MKIYILALSLAILTGCNSPESESSAKTDSSDSTANKTESMPVSDTDTTDNSLTAAEQGEGFKLLFDGKTKDGFHIYNNAADGSAWKIVDGTIHLDPKETNDGQTTGGGDMLTTDEYGNFHLKLDWRVDNAGNSGILQYVKEDKKYERSYHTGLEMQVLDNAKHPDAKIIKHRAGDLYDLVSSSPETVKPALQWNHVEIISKDGNLEYFLNGTKVMSTTLWDENWKKMVAKSKFKKWSDFGTFKTGRIGLQDHGNKVWYKNIKIKAL
ncbi:3-keto-disaccharide hydrolase [Flavitalea sp.]|nr:DUF1080 domain-containing protein [Flavitalea sp.]